MRRNKAVRRAFKVLKCFSLESPEWGVTEIGSKLGLAKSVAHADLTALTEENFLTRNQNDGRYSLGPEVIRLGQVFLQHSSLRRIAFPIMERVWTILEETIFLTVWLNSKAYVFDIVNSSHPLKVTVNIGDQLSLHAGAGGKVLLAFLPDEDREKLLTKYSPVKFTRKTVTDTGKLRRQLVEIRKSGYVVGRGDRYPDVVAAGVPIFGNDGQVEASICAAGPESRFTKSKTPNIVARLKEAANDISIGLGFSPGLKLGRLKTP